ncbi:MAG: AI-2E family transporter [Gemmatimonadota bacterium]|nr:MAG: AI-2E family transporter [Gemmatimonadota bacterium]
MPTTEKNRILVALLAILALVAVGFVLKSAKAVILPLMIAWLLSYILTPIINVLVRMKVPTTLSVFLVLILLLGIFYLGGVLIQERVTAFAKEYPKYQLRFAEITNAVKSSIKIPANFFQGIQIGQKVGTFVVRLSGSLMNFFSNLMMVLIFLMFLLLAKPYFKFKIKKAFSSDQADRVSRIIESISKQIGSYLALQFCISLTTGVLVWLALVVIGVDFAATWGILAFILNFIPTVGSIIASLLPVLVATIQFYPSYWTPIICLVSMLIIQMIMGNVVSPKVMGDRLNLSPVAILLSLLFWGWLWGIIGALLSVPFTAAIMIVCENIEPLQPISIMMGSGKRYQKEFTS